MQNPKLKIQNFLLFCLDSRLRGNDNQGKRVRPAYLILMLTTVVFLCVVGRAWAAEVFFEPASQELGLEDQFALDVFLSTDTESINAASGKIVFPAELNLREIRDGSSIVNFWIERPVLPVDRGKEIIFSGITPGGYAGRRGLLFSLIFQARSPGRGTVEMRDTAFLLNDGQGTPAVTKISNFKFTISKRRSAVPLVISTITDADLPENFIPQLARDNDLFAGKWFLVFATQDKGAGIDRYEVRESRRESGEGANWQTAASPYVLQDQNLASYIAVKAIDRAGRERIVVLPPAKEPTGFTSYFILGILTAVGLAYWFRKRHDKSK